MFLIILFGISLFVLILLFTGKFFESRSLKPNFISSLFKKLDPLAEKLFGQVAFRYRQVDQTLRYIFLVLLPRKSEESLKQAKEAAIGEYKRRKELVLGKRELAKNGSASFFLKKMKEDKMKSKPGRIEDEGIEEIK